MIYEVLNSALNYFLTTSPYLFLGLFISVFIKLFLPQSLIESQLGKNNFLAVVKATILGVPLPLCSCSVIPTTISLKNSGASNASVSSFLVATPETGVDSILLTKSLMGWPIAVLRLIYAVITALFVGLFNMLFTSNKPSKKSFLNENKTCCSLKNTENINESLSFKIKKAVDFSFTTIPKEIVVWFLVGIFFSALLEVFLPQNIFQNLSVNVSKFFVILIGVPLYICASAATPIAAALVAKGMSIGTALLLLTVGPATNLSNLLILRKHLGTKTIVINVITIVIVSLLLSWGVDVFITEEIVDINILKLGVHDHPRSFIHIVCAVCMAFIFIRSVVLKYLKA